MAVIWGLDMRDLQWAKFKSSYMFGNKDYHLRRTKFVVYQIAMIFCVVSESVGTAALSGHYTHLHNQTTPLNSLSPQIMSINSRKSRDSILLPESTTMTLSASLHTTSLSASPSPPSSAPLSSSISSSPNAMSQKTFAGPGGSAPSSSPS